MTAKIKLLKAKTAEELAEKMNKEEFFASQPMYADGMWYCFLYSDKDKQASQATGKPAGDELATSKQIDYLLNLGVKVNRDNLTKREASALIEEAKNKSGY